MKTEKRMEKKDKKIIQNVLPGSYGIMPRALDIEEAVLGAILTESQTARKYIAHIQPDFFYEPKNKLIFIACMELYRKNDVLDILTVTQQLREDGTLEDAGGPYNIAQMSGKMVSSAHIEAHICILSQFYMRRRIMEIGMTCTSQAADETLDIDTTLVEMQQALSDLAQQLPAVSEVREMPEVMDRVMEELEERVANGGRQLAGVSTGFPSLDEVLLGWGKGTLNTFGARPGEGKTAILIHTLLHAARQGVPVLPISLESRSESLVERLLTGETGIDPYDWRKGKLDAAQLEKVKQARQTIDNVTLRFFDHGDITVEEVCVMAKSLHAEGKCEMLGIDYMQLFNESKSNGSREQEVAKNSRMLKLLSLRLDIPVLVLSQLNRDVMTNDKQIPHLENIRESGSIEQDSDTVTLIYHPSEAHLAVTPETNYPVTPDMMMLMVEKNRNGARGTIYLSHNPSMTRFGEYAPDSEWLKRLPVQKGGGSNADDWRENDPNYQAFLRTQQEIEKKKGELPF